MPSGRQRGRNVPPAPKPQPRPEPRKTTPADLEKLPVTYQAIHDYGTQLGDWNPFDLRMETFRRIESLTGRPLITFVSRTHNVAHGISVSIGDDDLPGLGDLVQTTPGTVVDFFIVSNGGSAETTERIVRLLRSRFEHIRFIVPGNAFSAATLMCFAGDEVIMDPLGTLGPIDPQINGIPSRAIRRAFEAIEERLKVEGPEAIAAYLPLIEKYELHILEMCKSFEELSAELAGTWLSQYMLKVPLGSDQVKSIVEFFASYDIHKSHGRSIDRNQARSLGLSIVDIEAINGLSDLARSLKNQYEFWFDKTPFIKMYENSRGIAWGRQAGQVILQMPGQTPPSQQPVPQPGPPHRSG